jgi:hypothetical protein
MDPPGATARSDLAGGTSDCKTSAIDCRAQRPRSFPPSLIAAAVGSSVAVTTEGVIVKTRALSANPRRDPERFVVGRGLLRGDIADHRRCRCVGPGSCPTRTPPARTIPALGRTSQPVVQASRSYLDVYNFVKLNFVMRCLRTSGSASRLRLYVPSNLVGATIVTDLWDDRGSTRAHPTVFGS